MYVMVRLAVATFGSRMIWMPFETASIPVYVPAPIEYARTNTANSPTAPSSASPARKPCETSPATRGTSGRWEPMPPTIRTACVTRNSPKIGARIETDSFTPRRFRTTSSAMARRLDRQLPVARGPAGGS